MEQLGSHWTDFHEILYLSIFLKKKTVEKKPNVIKNRTRRTRTLHEDQYTFLIIPLSVILRLRNVLDKSCGGNQNTH